MCVCFHRYDPHVNTWSKQAAMLSRRSGAVAAVLGGHLYVVGGNDGELALNSGERDVALKNKKGHQTQNAQS